MSSSFHQSPVCGSLPESQKRAHSDLLPNQPSVSDVQLCSCSQDNSIPKKARLTSETLAQHDASYFPTTSMPMDGWFQPCRLVLLMLAIISVVAMQDHSSSKQLLNKLHARVSEVNIFDLNFLCS